MEMPSFCELNIVGGLKCVGDFHGVLLPNFWNSNFWKMFWLFFSHICHVDLCTTQFSCHFHLISCKITVFRYLQCFTTPHIHPCAHSGYDLWIKWPQIWVNCLSTTLLSSEIRNNFCCKCVIREWMPVGWNKRF